MRAPMTPEELQRYAETIVRSCVAAKRGDSLVVMVNFGGRDLAVAVAEAAYRVGALAVDVSYDDARVYAAKIFSPDPPMPSARAWSAWNASV